MLDKRVRLLPDTLVPCDEAGVPARLSTGGDGFDSRTGRSVRANGVGSPTFQGSRPHLPEALTVLRCYGGTPPWYGGGLGSTPSETSETGTQLPPSRMGLWSNGKRPAWRAGNTGSTPAGSTAVSERAVIP